MKWIRLLFGIALFFALTIVTQVGGIIFLLSTFCCSLFDGKIGSAWLKRTTAVIAFIVLYTVFTTLVVPLLARPFGRVPLPMFETRSLRPANIWTCLLNRNYVRLQLRDITYDVSERMHAKYGVTVIYLDANFPFINNFPLLPHRSHNDGKKLDLSFQYNDRKTGHISDDVPSFIGYGICEEPQPGEDNKPEYCESRGYWQYNLLRRLVPQSDKNDFVFDPERTKELVNGFAVQPDVGKIFIEPHLKARLGLTSEKIRFHGCQAVRHDDHVHVQLR